MTIHTALTTSARGLLVTFLFGALLVTARNASADEPSADLAPSTAKVGAVCETIVPIDLIPNGGVLYKPENIHGGRGPSFLVQNVAERTNKQQIEVRNARCELIAYFGLFRTDQPYGSRYYMRSGGSGYSKDEMLSILMQVGSTNFLVEGTNGKWIRVKNPLNREGSVRK